MPPHGYSKPTFPRFSIEDYQQYASAIKRVNDAAFDYFEALEQDKRELEGQLSSKEAELSVLKQKTSHTGTVSIIQSVLLLVATILFGFGVNLATSTPNTSAGWLLSVAGVLLQVLAILIPFLSKLRGANS